MVTSTNLTIDKTFRRLLISTEQLVENQSPEHWKIHQFVNTLTDMQKTMNRSGSRQRNEYQQRIDKLRQYIDANKLDEQIFPRQVQPKLLQPEQKPELILSVPISNETEKSLQTSSKIERSHLNRQQQIIQSEEDKQDEIAAAMSLTTESILDNAKRFHDIVAKDQKQITTARNLVDTNTHKLDAQSRRLKHNAYNVSNCWIYVMLIVVIITFIYLTLFMRMFRKRIITIQSSTSTSNFLLNNSINQTATTNTNITTTKSTDYISLLLNYANENHTDL